MVIVVVRSVLDCTGSVCQDIGGFLLSLLKLSFFVAVVVVVVVFCCGCCCWCGSWGSFGWSLAVL